MGSLLRPSSFSLLPPCSCPPFTVCFPDCPHAYSRVQTPHFHLQAVAQDVVHFWNDEALGQLPRYGRVRCPQPSSCDPQVWPSPISAGLGLRLSPQAGCTLDGTLELQVGTQGNSRPGCRDTWALGLVFALLDVSVQAFS